MARYFFDIQRPYAERDAIGLELADEAAARIEAVSRAGAYLHLHPAEVVKHNEITVHVRRPDLKTVFVVHCLALPTRAAS